MTDLETASSRREDSFLSSSGIDQSTVVMVAAILVVALLLLSLIGRERTSLTPVTDNGEASNAAILSETDATAPDIAGSSGVRNGNH